MTQNKHGGARKNSGRKLGVFNPNRKVQYATKLRPDQIKWLRLKKNMAKFLERLIDREMKE